MKKIVKESLYENFNPTDDPDGDKKFLEETVSKIENFESYQKLREYIFEMTCGFHFPFNPISPLREILRDKLQEFNNKSIDEKEKIDINRFLGSLKGEWKPIDIPDGAMF